MTTSNALRLPQAIVVGPQRTGTTWLYENLLNQVGLPSGVKETHFFDRYYDKRLNWYGKHFSHCPELLPIVEIAPGYFHSMDARLRISQHIPECKIICTVRNPVERAYSLYRLFRIYGKTKLSFEEAFDNIPVFKDSSRYVHHITAWQKTFGDDKVLILIFDDLKKAPQDYINKLCNFIGISEIVFNEEVLKPPPKGTLSINRYVASLGEKLGFLMRSFQMYKILNGLKGLGLRKFLFEGGSDLPAMNVETEKKLKAYFSQEVEALEKIIGRSLTAWK